MKDEDSPPHLRRLAWPETWKLTLVERALWLDHLLAPAVHFSINVNTEKVICAV